MPKQKYTKQQIAEIKSDFYEKGMKWPEIVKKYPRAAKSTLANYIYGYNMAAYNPRSLVNRSEVREEASSEIAIKKKMLADKLFRVLKIGQKMTLKYNPGKAERAKKQIWNDIKVREGKVIQITKNLITVQDIDRPWITTNISRNDLISQSGGIRIQLVG